MYELYTIITYIIVLCVDSVVSLCTCFLVTASLKILGGESPSLPPLKYAYGMELCSLMKQVESSYAQEVHSRNFSFVNDSQYSYSI